MASWYSSGEHIMSGLMIFAVPTMAPGYDSSHVALRNTTAALHGPFIERATLLTEKFWQVSHG